MVDPGPGSRLGALTVPALVAWGRADRIGDLEYGRELAAAIPGSCFTEIDDAGHLPQIEQPGALTDVVAGVRNGTPDPERVTGSAGHR